MVAPEMIDPEVIDPEPVPAGSIYVWCYKQGLRGVSWEQILTALAPFKIKPRRKDYDNWRAGNKRSTGQEYRHESLGLPLEIEGEIDPRIVPNLSSYPLLECDSQWFETTRWVPCSINNKPLVKWTEVRCTFKEALDWPGAKYLAENLKGCRWIVLDFDIDHDPENIDLELREFGLQLLRDHPTQALYKPHWMGFHLSYWTNRDIRTKHLPHVRIDICGNSPTAIVPSTGKVTSGQLRYFKTKESNDIAYHAELTEEIWKKIQDYSLTKDVVRKVKNND